MGGTAKVCWNVSKEGRGYLKVSCERRGKLKTIIRWLPEMWQQRLPETYHLKAEVTWYVSYEGRGYLKRIIRGPKLPETYHMRVVVPSVWMDEQLRAQETQSLNLKRNQLCWETVEYRFTFIKKVHFEERRKLCKCYILTLFYQR